MIPFVVFSLLLSISFHKLVGISIYKAIVIVCILIAGLLISAYIAESIEMRHNDFLKNWAMCGFGGLMIFGILCQIHCFFVPDQLPDTLMDKAVMVIIYILCGITVIPLILLAFIHSMIFLMALGGALSSLGVE